MVLFNKQYAIALGIFDHTPQAPGPLFIIGPFVCSAINIATTMRQLDPALRISNLTDWLPFHQPQDLATFAEGLRKAGLPE
jgi:hypothetical protein